MASADQQGGSSEDGSEQENFELELPHCVDLWEIELPEAITSLSLTPKGRVAAVGTIEDEIALVDTETGAIKCQLPGHSGGTNCVQFLSGAVLASCGEDGTAKLWNIAHRSCISEYKVTGVDADRTPSGHTVTHLTVATGGTSFAVASGRTVTLFTVTSTPATAANVTRREFPPVKSTIESLRFDKTQGNLMAAYNGGVTLWDLANKSENEAQALDFPYEGACLAVDGNPSMDWVVGGCHDATVHIWQIPKDSEGVECQQMTCGGYEKPVKFVDFDTTGRWMASAGGTRGTIWDFSNSPQGSIPTLTMGHAKGITCQAWMPDEPYLLATGAKDGKILFHDVEDIAEPGEPNICLPGVVADCESEDEATAIVWAPEGLFLVGHVSGKLRGWRLPEPGDSSEEESEEEEEEAKK